MSFWHIFPSRIAGAWICLLVLGASTARAELIPAEEGYTTSLCGYVYCDINNNGLMDAKELRIPDVKVTLQGTDDDGKKVRLTDTTDQWGYYGFAFLIPGTYSLVEEQPERYVDGKETLNGTVVSFSDMGVDKGTPTGNYNFGEYGLKTKYISKRYLLASYEPPQVPEPVSGVLLAIGAAVLLGGLAGRRLW